MEHRFKGVNPSAAKVVKVCVCVCDLFENEGSLSLCLDPSAGSSRTIKMQLFLCNIKFLQQVVNSLNQGRQPCVMWRLT